ncbi:MAG: MFS transporter [Dehalococcoidia bacterium]
MTEHADKLEKATAIAPAVRVASRQRRWRLQTFRSLRHRDFRRLWFTILGTSSGQWVEQIAVAWFVLVLTDSPTMVGLAFGSRALPSLFLSPLGGVIADRFPRRTILAVSQVTAAALATTMAVLGLTGAIQLWHIFAIILGFGVAWAINNPARHALIPQLVPREDMMNAIALSSTGFNIARSIGPFVGAALLATLGFGATFAVAAGLYAAVFFITLTIREEPAPQERPKESIADDLRAGVRYLKGDKAILTLVVLALFPIVIGMPYMALMPVFARHVLGKGEFGFGVMMAFVGIGSFAGTITLASMTRLRRGGLTLLLTGVVFGVSIFVFALSRNYYFSLLALLFIGGASMMYLSVNNTLIQMMVADSMRGRVMSLLMMQFGLLPLGAMAAGVLAEVTSPGAVVMVMGLMLATTSAAAIWLLPIVRQMEVFGQGTGRGGAAQEQDPALGPVGKGTG